MNYYWLKLFGQFKIRPIKMFQIYFVIFCSLLNQAYSGCVVTSNYARFQETRPSVNNRIVGGQESDTYYPFMVSILKRGYQVGGGVIIERHWILSAAHLFQDYLTKGLYYTKFQKAKFTFLVFPQKVVFSVLL